MANLHLKILTCVETEDRVGADDPQLAVDGQKVLLPRMRAGEAYPIDAYHAFDGDDVTITLHEADRLPGNRSDLLGEHTLSEEGSGTLDFTRDGANYQLSYTLTRS
ncbi:hypothetical protein ABZY90_26370 [Streptomyces sp. NPDC006422]|uniref:hypothetical protein n=1 Tax=unclassified Streptomyces TaxID=2593676 RepID=UPI0033ABF067